MKKSLIYSAALLFGVMSFSSCSDDDGPELTKLEEATYTMQDGLTLTVGGSPMLGKSITVTPSADMKTATLTMQSSFDFSSIPDFPEGLVSNTQVQCPGVLPGTPVETLKVDLVPNETGDTYSFSGDATSTYCTYKYSGTLTSGSLALEITDVLLKNQALANTTWNTYTTTDDFGETSPSSIHVVWEPETAGIDLGGYEMSLQATLQLVMVLPLIDDTTSAAEMLNSVLKSVTFLPDGNITAEYMDAANGGTTYTVSPVNMVQYVVSGEGKILIFLNPQAIVAADTKSVDLNQMIEQAWQMLTPMLANGLPLGYTINGDIMDLYIGNDVMLPILKNVLYPIVSDEDMIQLLIRLINSGDSMAEMLPLIESALSDLPAAIQATTNVEIGLSLKKAQ